jgi:hypothetical protein
MGVRGAEDALERERERDPSSSVPSANCGGRSR